MRFLWPSSRSASEWNQVIVVYPNEVIRLEHLM